MRIVPVIALASLLVVFAAPPAHAYLDPGTGSMIIQIIIGTIAGVAMAVRSYWHKISAFFRSRRASGGPPNE